MRLICSYIYTKVVTCVIRLAIQVGRASIQFISYAFVSSSFGEGNERVTSYFLPFYWYVHVVSESSKRIDLFIRPSSVILPSSLSTGQLAHPLCCSRISYWHGKHKAPRAARDRNDSRHMGEREIHSLLCRVECLAVCLHWFRLGWRQRRGRKYWQREGE